MSDELTQPKKRSSRLRRVTVLACLVLITQYASLITAQGQPAFFEPTEHYYKAKGRGIAVRWEVEPKAVHVGRDLAVTLVITGAQNPTEIVKPDLGKLKAFDQFVVTAVSDLPRDASAKEVRFAYKLAPRSTDVKQVPTLQFFYSNPVAAPGPKQFPSTRTNRDVDAPLTVLEAPKVERPIVRLEAPESLFRAATGRGVIGSEPFVPRRWAWLAAVLFGPLMAFGWFLAWRRVFPDAVQLARMRRSRAARRATDAIRKAHRAPDPVAAVANAVLGYLRARFPLRDAAVTPSEIAADLKELNVPEEIAEQVGDVFRVCDRARFAPSGDNGLSLAAGAEAAVARLESLA